MVGIQTEGIDRAIAYLHGMGDRLTNFGPVARDILLACQADVDERFESSPDTQTGGPVYGGVNWPHLSVAYLNANPRRIGGQILRDTGELQQSYGIGGAGNVAIARPNEVVFGSALSKAEWLANKRPQVFLHQGLIEDVVAIVEAYVVEGA